MDFWKANFNQSLHDVWVVTGAVPLVTWIFTMVTAVIIFLILKKIFPPESMRAKLIEIIVTVMVISLGAIFIFFSCLFFISPVQVYHKQNAVMLKLASANKSTPLKSRALFLTKQLIDFADEMDNGKVSTNLLLYQNEWSHRFPNQIDGILKELDAQGQFSQKIEKESNVLAINGYGLAFQTDSAEKIRDIASEIKRMADNLPESKKP